MKLLSKNKKVRFEYNILKEYTAGVKLLGSEIKPIKNSLSTINESYCYLKDGEIFIKGMNVPLTNDGAYVHKPLRDRKLLLNKKEISNIESQIGQKGLTIVVLSINQTKTGLIKVKIATAKGKKLYDKRDTLKKRDIDIQIKREKKL